MRTLVSAVFIAFLFAGLTSLPTGAVENQPDRTHLCNLDVDLVIDVSGSMGNGFTVGSRMHTAKVGASTFVQGLSTIKDRSALVTFESSINRYNPFTSNHALTDSNVNGLPGTTGGTNMAPAIVDSHNMFMSQGRPDARWIMVVLADGGNAAASSAAATAAKADGIELIVIGAWATGGLSNDLRNLASDPKDDYYKNPQDHTEVQQAWDEISDAVFKICANFEYDARCHHLPVFFEDTSLSPYANDPVVEAHWDMGDGTIYSPAAPQLQFYHKYAAPGLYNVTLRVVTQNGNEATTWHHVLVCNDPPELSLGDEVEFYVRAGYPIFFHVTVTDANQDPTRVTLKAGLLPGMSYEPDDRAFLWAPTEADVGTYDLYFEAVDYSWIGILPMANLTDESKITIHVVPPDQYPAAADDEDGDGVPDLVDNCPGVFNPGQEGVAGQGLPCATGGQGANDEAPVKRKPVTFNPAPDADADGVPDAKDNCPTTPNTDQLDADGDGVGDLCQPPTEDLVDDGPDVDLDFDGIMDRQDNCAGIPNPFQRDRDGDGKGDECDTDLDGDGVPQLGPDGLVLDNCPYVRNPDQFDSDGDGIGDACQNDEDGDGIPTYVAGVRLDNCPTVPNSDQLDTDGNGIGDACQTAVQSEAPASTPATPASMTPWVIAGAVGLLLVAALVLVLIVRPRNE